MKEEMMEEITDKIQEIESRREGVLQKFIDYLFWKDYSGGYIDHSIGCDIMRLMDTAQIEGPEGETWVAGDENKMLELANRIREKIGLPMLEKDFRGLSETSIPTPKGGIILSGKDVMRLASVLSDCQEICSKEVRGKLNLIKGVLFGNVEMVEVDGIMSGISSFTYKFKSKNKSFRFCDACGLLKNGDHKECTCKGEGAN